MKMISRFYLPLALSFFFFACGSSSTPEGYDKVEEGFFVKVIRTGNNLRMAKFGSHILMDWKFYSDADSLIDFPLLGDNFNMELEMDSTPNSKYDLMHIFLKLAEGDSIHIQIPADSLKNQPYFPAVVKNAIDSMGNIRLQMAVIKVFSKQEYAELKSAKPMEDKAFALKTLNNYLESNNIDVQPVGSGLRISYLSKGSGKTIAYGKTVKLHIHGRTLDGINLLNTFDTGAPLVFPAGDSELFPAGVHEALTYLKKGDRVSVVIPYFSAYGEKGNLPLVQPYTNLEYEIEIIDVQ